ncbi:hypothetical protein U9M48_029224 [Paspalum notatum var. saurae]|uniref:Uncharacterized protein n=1 Tax=Paspalum notatum var. saurae TaxID=547442 RepID=A0AAQ3X0X1_PASNO
MLRLRNLRTPLFSTRWPLPNAPVAVTLLSLQRFLSATAAAPTSPKPFAVEEYLVGTCGLTRAQALKASKPLGHISSPSRPDAVLAFLSKLGVSRPVIASMVASDPRFLCANLEKTLAPRVTELTELGLSRTQMARLVPLAGCAFRSKALGSNLRFWLEVMGSFEKLLVALKQKSNILGSDVEKVVKPNLALLQQHGVRVGNFPYSLLPQVLTRAPEHVQAALTRVGEFGLQRNSGMFHHALVVFAFQSQEKVEDKIRALKILGFSQEDVLTAVGKMPILLNMSMERLRRNVDFLTRDVGLETPYIAQRPVLVMYSLEHRLIPRHHLIKILDANGLLGDKFDFYYAFSLSEKKFLDRFIHHYKHKLPGLADAYTSSCAKKTAWNFGRAWPPPPPPAAAAAAMIHHLRRRILPLPLDTTTRLLAPRISPLISLHHLISSTASTTSPKPFAVEDYLVAACGLTRAQAVKASKKLSHLKSPSRPDAVLAFLSDLGLPRADIPAVVVVDPHLLCAGVERTLAPRVAELGGLGLSRPEIARMVPFFYTSRCSSLNRRVGFWLEVFGSFDKLLQALRMNSAILCADVESVAKPNLAFFQRYGISAREIVGTNLFSSRLFTMNLKSLQEAAEEVEKLGVEQGSPLFRRALALIAVMKKQDIARKMEMFQKLGFSRDQVLVILRKAPLVLPLSEEKIRRVMHFLTRDVGLEPLYIAQRPALFMYSLERRLLPRYWLLNLLRKKELLNGDFSYYYTASLPEKVFLKKFVLPYKDLVPSLADDYASRCSGKAPSGADLQEI